MLAGADDEEQPRIAHRHEDVAVERKDVRWPTRELQRRAVRLAAVDRRRLDERRRVGERFIERHPTEERVVLVSDIESSFADAATERLTFADRDRRPRLCRCDGGGARYWRVGLG